jgi:flagellar hook-associated protein 1 FlgK
LTFTGPNSYTRSDTGAIVHTYLAGQAIEGTVPATAPLSQWSLVLQGVPKAGDTFAVVGAKDSTNNNGIDYKLNAGNASAIMGLRDVAMFDGSSLTDGYSSIISQIGVRTQSANYTAEVSAVAGRHAGGRPRRCGRCQPGRRSRQVVAVPASLPGIGQSHSGGARRF